MIRSFKSKEAEKLFNRDRSKKLPGDIQRVALRKLKMLHRSGSLADLRVPPANRLERLKGRREGQYSIRINDQWRICFRWNRGDAFDVEIVDYHRG
jgi:proteic killer suppression protein